MKRFLKRSLITVLLLALLIISVGCGSSEPNEETYSEKEERERLSNFPPAPEGPDEEGYFPLVESSLVENFVFSKKGITDKEKPREKIASFEENPDAQEFLKESFPKIDDWKVVYQFHDYYLKKDVYDPFSYSFRDMYLPSSLVILETSEGDGFKRIELTYFESYYLTGGKEGYTPREETSFTYHIWDDEDWNIEGIEEAEKLCDGMYFYGVWFKERQEAVLFPETMEGTITVKDVKEAPKQVFSISESFYTLPNYKNGSRDYFLVTLEPTPESKGRLMLYNSETKLLKPFENIKNSYIIPLEGSVFAINNGDSLCLFDLESKTPEKPFKTISLREGARIEAVTTDRSDSGSHALAYEDENEDWNLLTFNTKGEVSEDYPLSIKKTYLYSYEFNFVDGIIYIDNEILDDNYRFATNASPESDHRCMLVQIERNNSSNLSKFIKPIYYGIIKGLEFSSPEEITFYPQIAERIFDLLEDDPKETFLTKFPGGKISPDGMMEYISLFFDVDKETVIKNSESFISEGRIEYTPEKELMPYKVSILNDTITKEGTRAAFQIAVFKDYYSEEECISRYEITLERKEDSPFKFKYISMKRI